MISFKPFRNYLKSNGITFDDMERLTGIKSNRFSQIVNSGKTSTDTIERICNALNCGLDDVICYTSEIKGKVNPNWILIDQKINELNLSYRYVSLYLNRNEHYFQNKKNKSMDYEELKSVAALFNCNVEDLIEIQ